jgi:hypothetical protein
VLQNYCEAMMLRWKPTKNAGSRSDKLCVNRICDTLLVKPADCGSEGWQVIPHQMLRNTVSYLPPASPTSA